MKDQMMKALQQGDFHIDSYGRVVVDNLEVLQAINGAAGQASDYDTLWNGACHNSRCS